MFLHAVSENSDQTGRMPRLSRVFAGRTDQFVGFVMRRLTLYSVSFLVVLPSTVTAALGSRELVLPSTVTVALGSRELSYLAL